jgi:hypothetical protein
VVPLVAGTRLRVPRAATQVTLLHGLARHWLTRFVLGGALGVGLLVSGGCRSTTTSPSGASVTASVTVAGKTLVAIRQAVLDVFQKNGYALRPAPGDRLVFEKRAGKTTSYAYGGLFNSDIWMRARVDVKPIGKEVRVIECEACRVRNRDDQFLEEELTSGVRRKPFEELLSEVKSKLAASPAAVPNPRQP